MNTLQLHIDLKRWKIFQRLDPHFAADIKRAYVAGITSIFDKSEEVEKLQNSPWKVGIMVMKNGDVYSIARSVLDLRLLGVSETSDLLPLVPVKIDALCGLQAIRAVSGGERHATVLTADGRIYQWGAIYTDDNSKVELEPRFLSGSLETKKVVRIASGEDHTVALTSEREVFCWGSNQYGQLGTGTGNSELDPVKISGVNGFSAKISYVTCSGWTSFALDDQGSVWSWGDHADKALGYATQGIQKTPARITLSNIKLIAAGNTHVLALSKEGNLYFWGRHNFEKLTVTPVKVEPPIPVKVTAIGAARGSSISAFKDSDGRVYFWGYAYGHYIPEPVVTSFTTMDELFASLDNPVMLRPVELDLSRPVVDKLNLSFNDKETSDVAFSVEGKLTYAHKMVLKLRSEHFRSMFNNDWKENRDSGAPIEIKDFTDKGFSTFLLYLYTDRIEPLPTTAEDVLELFRLADYYGEEDLKSRCEQQMKLLITKNNFSQVYSFAVKYGSRFKVLHNIVLGYGIPNLNKILKTKEYDAMADELKTQFIKELANQDVFAGLTSKWKLK